MHPGDTPIEFYRDGFTVSTDQSRLDIDAVLTLLRTTFWAIDLQREILAKALAHSIAFGLYDSAQLIGFGRAVTDTATYAYLTDVVVSSEYRGRGLGQWLVECILIHPQLQGLRRVALLTRDARRLYERLGFVTELAEAHTYMERRGG